MARIKLFFFLATLALSAVACTNSTTTCDMICSADSDCQSGQACLDVSGGGRRCLPTECRTCSVGNCSFTVGSSACVDVRCAD